MSFDPAPFTMLTYATLRIAGAALDPDTMTNLISLPPSEAWRKGDHVHLGRSDTTVVKKTGMWLFKTSDMISNNDLHEHLVFLAMQLGDTNEHSKRTGKALSIKSVLSLSGLQLTVSLFWHGLMKAAEPEVPQEFLQFTHFLGGRVVTDFASDDLAPAAQVAGRRNR